MILNARQVADLFSFHEVTGFEEDGPLFIWRLRAPLAVSYDNVSKEWRLYAR